MGLEFIFLVLMKEIDLLRSLSSFVGLLFLVMFMVKSQIGRYSLLYLGLVLVLSWFQVVLEDQKEIAGHSLRGVPYFSWARIILYTQ